MVSEAESLDETAEISVSVREGISSLVDDESLAFFRAHSAADE